MPFCPNCKFEYKPEIDICPDCGAKLVSKLEEEIIENIKYVPLRKVPTRLYAQMLQEALEEHDIPCLLKGDDMGVFLGALGTTSVLPVTVWVPEELKEKAEEIAFQILGEI